MIDPEQAVAAPPSRAQETVRAFAVKNVKTADVEVVMLAGPEAMEADGGVGAGVEVIAVVVQYAIA